MKIIAGNFKSNKTRKETKIYLESLSNELDSATKSDKNTLKNKEIYIFPATSSLLPNEYANLTLGVQNCHCEQSGAFTGEITLGHLEEFGIKSILIGHSERRGLFGDSDAMCERKFRFFSERGFKIFYCIGEDLAMRESGKQWGFLESQLKNINLKYENLIVAYEPIWAIGTGVNASAAQVRESMDFLKSLTNAPIIYGGSVNAKNASEILALTDGVLVGSASLQVEQFMEIVLA